MSRTYRAVRSISAALTGAFYEVEVCTLAPVPHGALLVVANHPNSVTDAGLLAAHLPRRLRFFAKASLVEHRLLGKVLRGAGAVPAYRRQDGETAKNTSAFQEVVRAWRHGSAVAVFPEGVSHDDVRLRQLRTGAARMLLAAHEEGVEVPVLPVGFFYEGKERFRSRVVVVVGEASPLALADEITASGGESRLLARAVTDRITERLEAVSVNASSREDLELVSALLGAVDGRDHLDPLELARACRELTTWRAHAPEDASQFCAAARALLERSGESGVAPADMLLSEDPGRDLGRRVLGTLAGGAVEVPLGLLGALGFAPAYWGAHGVYKVVGRTGSGGSPVKLAAGALMYGGWAAGACWMLRRKAGLPLPAAVGIVGAAGAAHLLGPSLLRRRALEARGALTQLRLRRSPGLTAQTRERLGELEARRATLHAAAQPSR